jgi:hypothetical protein
MNIEVAKKTLLNYLRNDLGITDDNISVEMQKKNVYITAHVSTRVIDDGILVSFHAFESGVFFLRFTLDKLGKTLNNYNLVNHYNQNVAWFKASIDDKNYLIFEHVSFDVANENVLKQMVEFFFNKFVDDSHVKYLKPLADITE